MQTTQTDPIIAEVWTVRDAHAARFGSTTETWIRLQTAYDIARALEREDEIEVERYGPQPA